MFDLLADLLVWLLPSRFFQGSERSIHGWEQRREREFDERIAAQGRTRGGARVLDGTVPGLTSTWVVGFWTVGPHRLRLGSSASVRVDAARPGFRLPTPGEAPSMTPDAEIVVLESGDGLLELWLTSPRRQWALDRLELGQH